MLPWETLDEAWKVWQGKFTHICTKTDTLLLSGCTGLIFINPGTKIDGCYYNDVVLMQQMLPSIRSFAGDAYVIQKTVRQRIVRIRQSSDRQSSSFGVKLPKFIVPDLWPPNNPDLNSIDYWISGVMQDCVYQTPVRCDRPEAELDWHMEQTVAEYRWWCWRESLREGKRKTFRTCAIITALELAWLCS